MYWKELGRHKACPYGGHGGRIRGTGWVGDRWHRQYTGDATPTWHGVRGALRGESPRTREGRRPDRPELQWSVISSQWSEASALALLGDTNLLELSRYKRCTRFHPHLEMHAGADVGDWGREQVIGIGYGRVIESRHNRCAIAAGSLKCGCFSSPLLLPLSSLESSTCHPIFFL